MLTNLFQLKQLLLLHFACNEINQTLQRIFAPHPKKKEKT